MVALILALLLAADPGFLEGDVVQCVSYGHEKPVAYAAVSIDGQSGSTTTDLNGHFVIPVLVDGELSVTATDGTLAGHRWYIPNLGGGTLDIGPIELDPLAAVQGCGEDA